jgi:hypothetical protein
MRQGPLQVRDLWWIGEEKQLFSFFSPVWDIFVGHNLSADKKVRGMDRWRRQKYQPLLELGARFCDIGRHSSDRSICIIASTKS